MQAAWAVGVDECAFATYALPLPFRFRPLVPNKTDNCSLSSTSAAITCSAGWQKKKTDSERF
jgi:hypothetical protein